MPFILSSFIPLGLVGAISVFDRVYKVPVRLASDMVKTVFLSKISSNSFNSSTVKQLNHIITSLLLILLVIAFGVYFGVGYFLGSDYVGYRWLVFLLFIMNAARLNFVIRSTVFVKKGNQMMFFRWALISVVLFVLMYITMTFLSFYSVYIYAAEVTLSYLIGFWFFNKVVK